MAKPVGGVKDVGNYRFFLFSTTPKKVNVTASSVCVGQPSRRRQGKHLQYGNIMWDPRVCRGIYVATSKNGRGSSSTQSSRCDLPQKKKVSLPTLISLQPDQLANTIPKKDSAKAIRSRAVSIFSNGSSDRGQNRSVTPPPVEGRFHVIAQTDPYFEPLEDDKPGDSVEVQTEEVTDMVYISKFPPHLASTNTTVCGEKGVQCEVWDIVDIVKAMKPVSENLIRVVIEQALKETMDEHELNSLVEQQNRYKQILRDETLKGEIVRINLMQTKVLKEKDNEYKRTRREHQAHHLLTVINFSSNYLLDFTEKSMEQFGEEWQNATANEPIKTQFRQWLSKETRSGLGRTGASRMLTDDIIKRAMKCDGEGACRVLPRVPVNSSVNIGQMMDFKNDLESLGEFDNNDDSIDLPISTVWNEGSSGSKKSVAFNNDSVTESERSESQNDDTE
ncbi:unnamed protein product [Orchesella dallaii]|uniref:Uncharacterized protein n=1 Tax=Orchesella dallaii TaxID=48710 RepID=A0ABP1Q3C0_9HEXA